MALDVRILVERKELLLSWLSLADGEVYRIGSESFGSTRYATRRQETSSPYVDGTFLVSSTLENIDETVQIWVYGNDHVQIQSGIKALLDALNQRAYRMYVEIDGLCQIWSCYTVRDFSINAQREFRHARRALVTAVVPRLPEVEYVKDASVIVPEVKVLL